MFENTIHACSTSRRQFLRGCAVAIASISTPVLESWAVGRQFLAKHNGPAQHTISLDQDWLFGGKLTAAASEPDFDDSAFSRVTLPHCVTQLSWQKWDPAAWADVWIYRRHFAVPPELHGLRLFLKFERVMAATTVTVNGHALPQHLGGFLPFEYEITDLVRDEDNVLAVAVDSRWLDIPPAGSPKGPSAVDYLLPGGINGSVSIHAVPRVFIRDVFAKPINVLSQDRRLEVTCSLDAGVTLPVPIRLVANLQEGVRTVASTTKTVSLEKANQDVSVSMGDLKNITLWDVDNPHLYDLVVTLFLENEPLHRYRSRVGFREARFDLDGFFLNGKRLQLFGLDRHELYPYVGFAAPPRLLRRDAEILRHTFNCNAVRCSHYPQSEAFLDACDELGLMVWEEIPGWQYIGDDAWQQLALRDTEAMVRRDRNHPAIIIWGVRINESRNDPALYSRTREIAKSLDDSRPTSGSMTPSSTKDWQKEWHQDVFAFDDYHAEADGSVGIRAPLPSVPYMLAETVGQFDYGTGRGFDWIYRRAGDPGLQMRQALLHAQAHSKAASYPRCAGVIAWCALDYASLMNAHDAVKCPGVADVFRIPKLGASFYMAQVDPGVRPVIEPAFYWDFGPRTPSGPGERAAIFSNCDRLELAVDGKPYAVLHPDRSGFPNIKYPPFFADLKMSGAGNPELHIRGYVGDSLVLSRSFSADHSGDRLWLHADDRELEGNGSDATRLAFGAVDRFGAPRPFVEGEIALEIDGPAIIVGDNPFQLGDSGGVGAVWIRTLPGKRGRIRVEASHTVLGRSAVEISVV